MEQLELISYREMLPVERARIIQTIDQDFDGWENYNSLEDYSLFNLLLENKRFDTGDYHFLMDGAEPICGAGFYRHGDVALILTRAYTWPRYRPSKFLSNVFLPLQLKLCKGVVDEVWLNVNGYNRRILSTLARNGAVGPGQKNQHDYYSLFEFVEEPVEIYGVQQYIAKLKLSEVNL